MPDTSQYSNCSAGRCGAHLPEGVQVQQRCGCAIRSIFEEFAIHSAVIPHELLRERNDASGKLIYGAAGQMEKNAQACGRGIL
jgi:hypothetical protein